MSKGKISLRGMDKESKLNVISDLAKCKFQLNLIRDGMYLQKYHLIDKQIDFVDINGYLYDIMPMHIIKNNKNHVFHKFRKNKYAIYNRKLFFENNGYEIIGEYDYNGVFQKLKCRDNNGFLNNISISDLTRGCPELFSVNNKYIIFNIKLFLKVNNLMCSLISKEYIGTHGYLDFKCEVCGDTFKSTFAAIKRRCENNSDCCCLDCSYLKNTSYNITIANRDKEKLIGTSCNIYFIKMFNDDYSEEFYKIGITKNTLKERYDYNNLSKYNYEKIIFYNTNLYNAINIEKDIKMRLKKYKYIPNNKFGGYTECFTHNNDDFIINAVKNMLVN